MTIGSRISKMSELLSIQYTSLRDEIEKHIDRMAGVMEQLRGMGTTFDDALAIGSLVASIEVQELMPTVAAIKTLSDKDIRWKAVSSRLIEEVKNLKSSGRSNRAHSANVCCGICGKTNHTTSKCFLNPLNPNNKLNLKISNSKEKDSTSDKEASDIKKNENSSGSKKKKKKKDRSAIARIVGDSSTSRTADRMMLDSGTTSHLTASASRIKHKQVTDITINLADNLSIKATEKGTRTVKWKTSHGKRGIHLSNTLVVPSLAMSLLSVPSLLEKNIGVLFLPSKAVLIDLEDDFSILGYVTQDDEGLFYISDSQDEVPSFTNQQSSNVMACMDVLRSEYVGNSDTDSVESSEGSITSNSSDSGDGEPAERIKNEGKLWHSRLGHAISEKAVQEMVKNGKLPHINCSKTDCEHCATGKYRRKFKGSLTNSTQIGNLHVYTKGKVSVPSVNGHNHFLTIVEELSRCT